MPNAPLYPQGPHYGSSDGDSNKSAGTRQKSPKAGPTSGRNTVPYDPVRSNSFDENDGGNLPTPLFLEIPPRTEEKPQSITWRSLPNKTQLAILVLARLSEPLVQSSLRSYVFYQLKSFDRSLPDSTIASQAGIIHGAFAAAQLCTAMLWGSMSDLRGRKGVILFGLSGSMLSCIGFGFSRTFTQALIFRSLGGALNGNVGVLRTMVSEIIKEKKFQSRAFLLLPMTANVGVIIGPLIGGLLSDPVASYPGLFGGVQWLERYPYSPPNILSAFILAFASLVVWMGLEETHEAFSHNEDYGIRITRKVASLYRRLRRKQPTHGYSEINGQDSSTPVIELTPTTPKPKKLVSPHYRQKLPFRQLFTYNVICVLISHASIGFSLGTFQSVFYTFLSTPVYDPATSPPNYTPHLPFKFTGGTGLSPRDIGFSMASLGVIGIALQLILYPAVSSRLGTVLSWRIFLYSFPITYTLVPFLSTVPSSTPPPSEKTGVVFWTALIGIIFVFVIGRTFAAPATQILVNNCCPHPTVLGTVHGIGQSASAAARTIGPALGGWIYGVGLDNGYVGATFWALAISSGLSCFASTFVKDGNGHEIRLEGDDEAEAEAEEANRGFGNR